MLLMHLLKPTDLNLIVSFAMLHGTVILFLINAIKLQFEPLFHLQTLKVYDFGNTLD